MDLMGISFGTAAFCLLANQSIVNNYAGSFSAIAILTDMKMKLLNISLCKIERDWFITLSQMISRKFQVVQCLLGK